jgi:folate-binding protein YgfZ
MERTILAVAGPDRDKFLHGLLTRDVLEEGLGYAALLNPQGKYLADFLTLRQEDRILLDVATPLAGPLAQRLGMYRLRSKVEIAPTDMPVATGTGPAPDSALPDPRHAALGWRLYGRAAPDETDRDALRVAHLIPETGIELIPGESYILEMGFERLGGVDFRKGCYVGQEVTARMKHKTELRKGLARVAVDGAAEPGTPITRDGRPVGTLHTRSGGRALAYLRLDRAGGEMAAGAARVTLDAARP